jgi:hypothetical protein
MEFWQFQKRLTTLLLAWASASIGMGIALGRQNDFRHGIGEQFIGWGLVNAAIALFGQRGADRRRQQPEANTPAALEAERRKLSRLLWLNAGLDVVYVLGGWVAMRGRGASDERWRGRGVGIMLQGGFLFFFDVLNALALRRLKE